MANKKITDLPEITSAPASSYIPLVDTTDISASPTGTNKKIKLSNLTTGSATSYPWKGIWQTATSYAVNDCVQSNGSSYVCLVSHTSGTFATDLSNAKWSLLVQGIPTALPTVSGSKGANAALTSLIAGLVSLGLIIDTTT